MDDMAAYYPPPPPPPGSVHYPYYQQPPPPQPPPSVAPPLQHHLVQPYFPQHPPPFSSYAPALVPQPSHDEVRTLFVAGLPEDVKPREIYNLFREFPGYESSHLRTPTEKSQPFAFAVFLDQQSAIGAMHALNGMVFDLEKGSTLYIDLAKSNSRSKRSRTDDERSGSDKKARGSSYSRGAPDSGKRIASNCLCKGVSLYEFLVCNFFVANDLDVLYDLTVLYNCFSLPYLFDD
ncbi:unnamed protein product [Prunus armeniaca]